MHQFKKDIASHAPKASKVRLPKHEGLPEIAVLKDIHAQALNNPGQEIELPFSQTGEPYTYLLSAKLAKGKTEPGWTLLRDDGKQSEMLWQYEDCDISLISDFLTMLEKPAPKASFAQPTSHTAQAGQDYSQNSPGAAHAASNSPQMPSREAEALKPKLSPDMAFPDSVGAQAYLALTRAARAIANLNLEGIQATASDVFEGDLKFIQMSTLLQAISMAQLTGKLEVMGEDSVGSIFFYSGITPHAATTTNTGDSAVAELVTWRSGLFRFNVNEQTTLRSVENRIDKNIMDGMSLLDQQRHLNKAGLTHESYLRKKHKKLSEGELKVMLSKGADVDFNTQLEVYTKIGPKCTLSDLLRDRPMGTSLWTAVLFNFITCGIIEIGAPDAMERGILDFTGENKSAVENLSNQLIRQETGIMTYAAFLYFLRHEYYRFEAYGWPLSVVIFEMNKKSESAKGGLDLIAQHEAKAAAKRVALVKRPLDILAHFESIHYALLLPNTNASSGAYVANRILQALTAAPLSEQLDNKHLHLAFGVGSIPQDGENLENLILSTKEALSKARTGDFPVVMAYSL